MAVLFLLILAYLAGIATGLVYRSKIGASIKSAMSFAKKEVDKL